MDVRSNSSDADAPSNRGGAIRVEPFKGSRKDQDIKCRGKCVLFSIKTVTTTDAPVNMKATRGLHMPNESAPFTNKQSVLLSAVVLVSLVFGIYCALNPATSTQTTKIQAVVPPTATPKPIVMRPAEEIAKPHLEKASKATDEAIEIQLQKLAAFIAKSKEGSTKFSEAALSFESKSKLVMDFMSLWWSKNAHKLLLQAKFAEHILKQSDLEALIERIGKDYASELQNIESQMIKDLRADTEDFPRTHPLVKCDSEEVRKHYESAISSALGKTGEDVTRNITTMVGSEIAAGVAVRLGLSMGLLTGAAAAAPATFGITLVVGVAADMLFSWIWDLVAKPKQKLAADIETKIDEIHTLILNGKEGHGGLRDELKKVSKERQKIRHDAVIELIKKQPEEAK